MLPAAGASGVSKQMSDIRVRYGPVEDFLEIHEVNMSVGDKRAHVSRVGNGEKGRLE